jgi:uncharacterized membrane protein
VAHHSPFGRDRFGRAAEAGARFFGTPQYIIGQTLAVVVWIVLNAVAFVRHWDPYPFILLNRAQTRQAERDAVEAEKLERHRQRAEQESLRREDQIEKLTGELRALLEDEYATDERDTRPRRPLTLARFA